MRSLFLGLALAGALTSAAFAADTTPQTTPDELFIVVTSADPHVQGMAMILGLQARAHHSEVRLLLCGPGGDMALKDQPAPSPLKPMDKTPQQLLQGLIAQGAKAEVCGLYLPNGPHTAESLIDGISPVKPPVIGDYMAQPNVRYFTF